MTFFQRKVYRVVEKIPKGRVISYRDVAKLVGSPQAWRAVGNILNKNRNPKIPCHRVIKSNGQIGGYNKGVNKKTSLLEKEGMVIRESKIVNLQKIWRR